MNKFRETIRTPVKRIYAENYLLISIAFFAASVILTRLFLELTNYPQVGNSVLHIAHAIWGGLLLLLAALLPLILANQWVLTVSAILSGLGVGLFIDEVGKFITQQNDYFYPPAAPLIYAFFLMLVLLFFLIRRIGKRTPRAEMYRALEELRELIDNNLDEIELERLMTRLEIASRSERPQIKGLSEAIHKYLKYTDIPLVPVRPGISKRLSHWFAYLGERLGRKRHRNLILFSLSLMLISVIFTGFSLTYIAISPQATIQDMAAIFMTEAEIESVGSGFWFILRITLQLIVGFILLSAIVFFIQSKDERGVNTAIIALLSSLTGVLLLTFYLNQFSAVLSALYQFAVLLLILAYKRWYIETASEKPG